MNFAAVFHRAQAPWSYALNADELVLRLQTGPEVERVFLHWGDPFEAGILGGAERWHGQSRELTDPQPLDHALWWTAVIRPPYKRCRYHFELHSGGQVWLYGEDGFCTPDRQDGTHPAGFYQPWMNPADIPAPPAWVRDTVWYQIFPDRFCRSKGSANQTPWREGPVTNRERFGGDLPGICEKLDYLASLGVSGLYLNPIFAADSVHRYDTRDYTRVDPDLGTNADLKQLVEQAHARGIRVMLDAVFNHCGPHFAPWRDVMENGPDSPYWDWFMVNRWPPEAAPGGTRDGRYFSFAFASLPQPGRQTPGEPRYSCRPPLPAVPALIRFRSPSRFLPALPSPGSPPGALLPSLSHPETPPDHFHPPWRAYRHFPYCWIGLALKRTCFRFLSVSSGILSFHPPSYHPALPRFPEWKKTFPRPVFPPGASLPSAPQPPAPESLSLHFLIQFLWLPLSVVGLAHKQRLSWRWRKRSLPPPQAPSPSS